MNLKPIKPCPQQLKVITLFSLKTGVQAGRMRIRIKIEVKNDHPPLISSNRDKNETGNWNINCAIHQVYVEHVRLNDNVTVKGYVVMPSSVVYDAFVTVKKDFSFNLEVIPTSAAGSM
ncbi:hypothetical protein CEXT_100171 [Caerostris extrusa]|uniref:Uncharacterized protein n=1 Tax=Caerostris extrusa TaxID=172846 RepID=A0AAV4T2J3_CAEEX|nr:hypothetical protein CEXT_100171 [Caerostris extrusa]